MDNSSTQLVQPKHSPFNRLAWLSPILALVVSFVIWHEVRNVEDASLQRTTQIQLNAVAELLQHRTQEDINAVRRMEKQWERVGGTPKEQWLADAELYVHDHPELVALGWVDPDNIVQWIAPIKGNESAVGLHLVFEGRRAEALRKARESGEHALSRPIDLVQGGKGQLAFYSLEEDGKLAGYLSAVIRPKKWIEKSIGETSKRFHIKVTEGDTLIYLRDDERDSNPASWTVHKSVNVADIQYHVNVRPTLATVASYRSSTPALILASGFLVAALLVAVVSFWKAALVREIALAQSEARFDRAIRGTNDGLWEWNVGTQQVWYAPRFKELLGYDDAQFPNLLDSFLDHLHPDDKDHVWAAVQEHVSSREEYNVEYRLLTREQGYRWFFARGQCEDDVEQGLTRMSGSIQDITEQKAVAQEIDERNKDLETLLHVTSHDLSEPLRAVRNFASLIESEHSDQLDEEGVDFLRRVVRGADRLKTLLDDILTLSRAQRENVQGLSFNLRKAVDTAVGRLADKVESTNASINIDPVLPQVEGDPKWITQAVYNLMSNALKFSADGEKPRISVEVFQPELDGDLVGLKISDRGTGIPTNCNERVFKLFQRAVGRNVPGTGAGLTIVRQIAERHNGRVWHEPREGGGTIFYLLLPSAKDAIKTDGNATDSEVAA